MVIFNSYVKLPEGIAKGWESEKTEDLDGFGRKNVFTSGVLMHSSVAFYGNFFSTRIYGPFMALKFHCFKLCVPLIFGYLTAKNRIFAVSRILNQNH